MYTGTIHYDALSLNYPVQAGTSVAVGSHTGCTDNGARGCINNGSLTQVNCTNLIMANDIHNICNNVVLLYCCIKHYYY